MICNCQPNKSFSRFQCVVMALGLLGASLIIAGVPGLTQRADASVAAQNEVADTVLVRLETTKGNIDLELNQEKAPISVANFIAYIEKGHYNGTIFHRVIPNFMVQGGGFDENMTQKPTGEGIENEWENGLSNERGTIAMARLGNQPNSATAQFFINVANNAFLDTPRDGAGYAVFGKVVEGMDIIDAIVAVPTTSKGPHQNVPVEPIIIKKASVITEDGAEREDG